jgi:hypothetical protein
MLWMAKVLFQSFSENLISVVAENEIRKNRKISESIDVFVFFFSGQTKS